MGDAGYRPAAGTKIGARWMLGRDRFLPRFYSLPMSPPKVVAVLEG